LKGSSRWVAAALAAATLLLAGCSGTRDPNAIEQVSPSLLTVQPVECHIGIRVPGFDVVDQSRVPMPDRVGLTVKMTDAAGRKVLLKAGLPGDFAEGATPLGQVSVVGGLEGWLYGAGSVWVLTWDSGGPCGPHVAIGNDISKYGFVVAMTRAGVMLPGD
jgi:hypothetical protein